MKRRMWLLVALLVGAVLVGVFFYVANPHDNDDGEETSAKNEQSTNVRVIPDQELTHVEETNSSGNGVIADLVLPFRTTDLLSDEGVINPFGIVRSSSDFTAFGHSGIDIPLRESADVIAVADGRIVNIISAQDPWGGMGVYQLIADQGKVGEGIAFIYEHITPRADLTIGTEVKQGEVLGTKTAPNDFTAHFQLSDVFNSYQYTRTNRCWVEYLDDRAKNDFLEWWNKYRISEHLENSWRSITQEDKKPYEGLLDVEKFPTGPQLCYSEGTDVR